jgi:hypothetical protein
VKPSFFREKMKRSSKYKVTSEAFIFLEKKANLHENTKSGVKSLFFRETTKIANPSSKYEVKV